MKLKAFNIKQLKVNLTPTPGTSTLTPSSKITIKYNKMNANLCHFYVNDLVREWNQTKFQIETIPVLAGGAIIKNGVELNAEKASVERMLQFLRE